MGEKTFRPRGNLVNGPILTFVPEQKKHYKDLNKMSKSEIDTLFSDLAKEQKVNTLWACRGCGEVHKVQNTNIIQTHYYISPHGCTGGDYWLSGERQLECSDCGAINRLINEENLPASSYFKEVTLTHEHS